MKKAVKEEKQAMATTENENTRINTEELLYHPGLDDSV